MLCFGEIKIKKVLVNEIKLTKTEKSESEWKLVKLKEKKICQLGSQVYIV